LTLTYLSPRERSKSKFTWQYIKTSMTLKTTDLNSLTKEQIVDILTGGGVTVENITITGTNEAIGSFSGGKPEGDTKGIGIEEGVILSSGNVANAIGPNNKDNQTSDFGTPGDPDLDKVLAQKKSNTDDASTQTTNDAIVLEFDFIPKYEQFLFEYVFASEEYNEFADSEFNDIFSFFLNGQNIALIPGTATPVAINNINAGKNKAFYLNNRPDTVKDGNYPYDTQFDGFTVPLAAQKLLTPGEKQHLKLVIADTSDSILDSAVFLKKGSLQTLQPDPNAKLTVDEKDIFSLEGSPDIRGFATLKFTLGANKANSISEVGVFVVDDAQNKIAGVAPGETDYEKLAMTGSRSRVLFAGSPHDLPDSDGRTRLLNFNTGDRLGFYFVTNGTTDTMLSDFPKGFAQLKPQVFFAFPEENADGLDHLNVTENQGVFTLNWENSLKENGFDDFSMNVEVLPASEAGNLPMGTRRQGELEMEMVDLSSLKTEQTTKATFSFSGDADYSDSISFYQVQDANGTIIDAVTGKELTPEDKGYAAAAIKQRVVNLNQDGTASIDLAKGMYAPFMIANGTPEQWLQENPNNWSILGKEKIVAYFPYIEANPDGFEHVVLLENNTFGFEDNLAFKADRDYNDAIVQVGF
jgi:hypothetical protein